MLLPGSLHESVGQAWIWQNVFNAIPDHLKRPWNGNIALEITIGEDSISSISRRAFADTADRNVSPNVQRAVFLVNNPGAQHYLHAKHLPAKRAFVSMPIVLSKFDAHHWQGEAQMFGSYISRFDPLTQEMYQEVGPQDTYLLARIAENLVEHGASVGQEDIIRATSYGMAGVAGYAVSGQMALAGIDNLARQIYADAIKQLGEKVVVSKKSGHLRQVTQFICILGQAEVATVPVSGPL